MDMFWWMLYITEYFNTELFSTLAQFLELNKTELVESLYHKTIWVCAAGAPLTTSANSR